MRRYSLGVLFAVSSLIVAHGCGPRAGGGDSESHFIRCTSDDACLRLGDFVCAEGRCQRHTVTASKVDADAGGSIRSRDGGSMPGFFGGGPAAALGSPATDGCTHAVPAQPPAAADGSASLEFVVAQRTGDFGDRPPAPRNRDIGFDLDGQCTTGANQGTSCNPRAGLDGAIDGVNGIDNAFGEIVQLMNGTFPNASSTGYSRLLEQGIGSNLIFHVTGYSGFSQDPSVNVDVRWAAPPDLAAGAPVWDGNDVLRIDMGAPTASSVGPNAYVADGKLVAMFNRFSVRVDLESIPSRQMPFVLSLIDATVQCELTMNSGRQWVLGQCVLGGTVQANDLLHQVSGFADPADPTGTRALCSNSPSYTAIRANLCGVADLPFDPSSGGISGGGVPGGGFFGGGFLGGGPGGVLLPSCAGISVGMAFETVPVRLGEPVSVTSPAWTPCSIATDSATDNCVTPFMGSGTRDGG